MNKKGFTLLELIVVIIILGILASIGFTQYTKLVEKGRTAEAKMLLGQIRSAEIAYKQQYGSYTSVAGDLAIDTINATCVSTNYYFTYAIAADTATATRCTVSSKTPGTTTYTITLSYEAGVFGGSAGYY